MLMKYEIPITDLKLSEYGVTRDKLNEMVKFCKKYDEFKKNGETEKIKLIDETLEKLDYFRGDIKKSITTGIAYEYLGYMPVSRKQFYQIRRYFFYLLSKRF